MDFNKMQTKDLIEIYGQISNFLNFLEKEKQAVKSTGEEEK